MRRLKSMLCTNLRRVAAVCSLYIVVRGPTVWSDCISAKYEIFPQHVGCLPASPWALQPRGVDLGDQTTIVNEIARIRRAVAASDMQAMTWDFELQELAQRWAENCNATRDENLSVPGRFAFVGQTLANGLADWRTTVVHWGGSQQSFTYGNSAVMNFDSVADYVQLVWASSSRVGCGFSACSGIGKFYVCNFGPGRPTRSNYALPYTSGTPCGSCPQSCNQATQLCDCGAVVCQNGGTLALNRCVCSCAYPHNTGPNCGLNCSGLAEPAACSSKTASDCQTSPAVTVQCPNLCRLCPYAAADYRPPVATTTTPKTSSALDWRADSTALGLHILTAWLASEWHHS